MGKGTTSKQFWTSKSFTSKSSFSSKQSYTSSANTPGVFTEVLESYSIKSTESQDINFGTAPDTILYPAGSLNQLSFRVIFRSEIGLRQETILGKWGSSNRRAFILRKEADGRVEIFFSKDGLSTDQVRLETTGTPLTNTQWKDLIFTIDNAETGLDKFKLYINNTLYPLQVISGTISTANIQIDNNTEPLRFGQFNNAIYMFGFLNQIGATTDVITPSEVSDLWNSGSPRILDEICDNVAWNCYGGTFGGTNYTMPDYSGNSLNGTSTNVEEFGLNQNISPYNTEIDVYLANGQSNMVGREPLANLPVGQQGAKESYYVFDVISTIPSFRKINSALNNNQFGQSSNEFGTEFELMELRDNLTQPLVLLKYAIGGTSLGLLANGGTSTNWNINTVGSLWDNLQGYMSDVESYWSDRGVTTVNWKGQIWIQGERDSQVTTIANNYYDNLTDLGNALIALTGNSDFKFYIVRTQDNWSDSSTVRTAQQDFVNDDPTNRRLINADDATTSDGVHYDAAGNALVGGRIVTEIENDI